MREQPTKVKTAATKRLAMIFAAIILSAALAATALFIILHNPPYTPPHFEPRAASGMPEPPENFGFSKIDAMGLFTFYIAGVMYQQEDGSLQLYLTNPKENEAYLLCEIVDLNGKTLYKSGLLRPGEYVDALYPAIKLKNVAVNVEVNVYALDLEHFYSAGAVTLNNILQAH